ncbi:QsdR family transcriptional regulator [Pseudomarimonas salicorniae]|uniref:QsdR family transcriptional regulator n=1 Tax=Pseudomarimonas salicorniae TaxID=2933270 RepID=A0ABT0GDY1_9GAMM|nr:QsdR family transcriptional regulator [Lysobacter sp. CAU 1642]MCK7592748.1 QsdR family transcriptional regulator [Lysobacter sp. CAU 1642]
MSPAERPSHRAGGRRRADGQPRATPADALRLARKRWLDGERLDIGQLAQELGVARATLFRWVGSRDLLLAEVLWSMCAPTLQRAADSTRGEGVARIAMVCETAVRQMMDFEPLRRFIAQDADLALRLLTSKASPVQARTIAAVRDLLESERRRGSWTPPLAIDTLAYLMVRLGESFLYANVLSGQQVDVGDTGLAVQLLLSGRIEEPRLSERRGGGRIR